jgi:CheY-like chemotaxis protein
MKPREHPTLLVINRGALSRIVVSRIGTRIGFETVVVSCETALSALSGEPFSAIVVDLPDEGLGCPNFPPIARQIGPEVPVVLLSHSVELARAGADPVRKQIALNVVSVLLKPLSIPDLDDMLDRIHLRLSIGLSVRPFPPPAHLRRVPDPA